MIDWINAVVPYRHSSIIAGGGVQYIDGEGVLSEVLPRKRQVRGSFDAGLMIHTSVRHRASADPDFGAESIPDPRLGAFTHVWISGSPKFLQGHNLFGTSDVCRLVELMATKALTLCGLEVSELDARRWRRGDFQLTVLDVTEMLDVGSDLNAQAVLRAAGDHARLPYREKHKERHGGTVYFGRRSRRWALKLYSKADELASPKKAHQLPPGIERREELTEYARGCVRAELRLHSMELKKRGLDSGQSWLTTDARKVWAEYMNRIVWSGNAVLVDDRVQRLPGKLRGTYALWAEGHRVASMVSRATFFRHRKELLAHGIDITSAPERTAAQVVPLVRLIEARPKAVPRWAYGTPLLAA